MLYCITHSRRSCKYVSISSSLSTNTPYSCIQDFLYIQYKKKDLFFVLSIHRVDFFLCYVIWYQSKNERHLASLWFPDITGRSSPTISFQVPTNTSDLPTSVVFPDLIKLLEMTNLIDGSTSPYYLHHSHAPRMSLVS